MADKVLASFPGHAHYFVACSMKFESLGPRLAKCILFAKEGKYWLHSPQSPTFSLTAFSIEC